MLRLLFELRSNRSLTLKKCRWDKNHNFVLKSEMWGNYSCHEFSPRDFTLFWLIMYLFVYEWWKWYSLIFNNIYLFIFTLLSTLCSNVRANIFNLQSLFMLVVINVGINFVNPQVLILRLFFKSTPENNFKIINEINCVNDKLNM